jgi:hypothetical protein
LITLNTNLGVERKSRIDSILETSFPFDPKDLSQLFIINVSTTSLTDAVFAGYANLSLKVLRQDLFVEFTRVGSAYQSLSNPFIRNDQQQLLITDRFDLLRRKIFVNLRYFNLVNNLENVQLSTIINHTGSMNLTFSPGLGKPQFFTNVMFQNRLSSGSTLSIVGKTNDQTINLSFGSSWSLKGLGMEHFLSLQYNHTLRNDQVRIGNDNTFSSWGIIVNERFSFPLTIELNYNASRNEFMNLVANNNLNNSWMGILGYELRKAKLIGSIGAGHNNMLIGNRSQETQRQQYFVRMTYKGIKGIQLDLEGGLSPYKDWVNLENKYNEQYFFARLSYNLNGRNLAAW